MKRCCIMFALLVFMLVLAVFTDRAGTIVIDDRIVESELEAQPQLTNEIISDDVLKN